MKTLILALLALAAPAWAASPTASPSFTQSPTFTISPTRTASPTRTITRTFTITKTATTTRTATPTATASVTPAVTRTASPTRTVSQSPTFTISPTPAPGGGGVSVTSESKAFTGSASAGSETLTPAHTPLFIISSYIYKTSGKDMQAFGEGQPFCVASSDSDAALPNTFSPTAISYISGGDLVYKYGAGCLTAVSYTVTWIYAY